ncbi:MAG TPA: hypothetical protein ENH55_11925 [Aurantimonas coralicida]|uniref:Uncharacterized protein n=2 Tax=root TaxID=1 RepID=A0A9C9TG93_9HYPH|nr:hypothetical protein [Aurantimonas coralicida]HEU00195.1 hypothetical protein [Aurantimonas coralicida]
MATTTYTELSHRGTGRSKGFMRSMLDRMIEAREREARRYIEDRMAFLGRDGFELGGRESLFEGRTPERR